MRRLQRELSSRDFAEMLAYARIEPIGDKRGDFQAASVAAAAHNAIAAAFGGARIGINDCLLKFGAPRQQTPEEMRDLILQTVPKGRK